MNNLKNGQIRTHKECRQRYINHARMNTLDKGKVGEWSSFENGKFLEFFRLYGTKWALIAQAMPERYFIFNSRSEMSLKNRFYSSFRKMTRKINSVELINKTSRKRFIKYENLVRII